MKAERWLGRAEGFDFEIEDHGLPVLSGSFDGGSFSQGLGYQVDIEFIKRFLRVFGVYKLQEVNGESCWITNRRGNNEPIILLEPLYEKDGEAFDIEEWGRELRKKP